MLRFEWNHAKSRRNLSLRGFDFAFATLIFDGLTLERVDDRRAYGERRIVAVGKADGVELTVVYTDRPGMQDETIRRIISARRANRRERRAYGDKIDEVKAAIARQGRPGETAADDRT